MAVADRYPVYVRLGQELGDGARTTDVEHVVDAISLQTVLRHHILKKKIKVRREKYL